MSVGFNIKPFLATTIHSLDPDFKFQNRM